MCFLISKKIYEVTTGKLYQQKKGFIPFLQKLSCPIEEYGFPKRR